VVLINDKGLSSQLLLRDAIHSVSFPQGSSNEETQMVARAKIRVGDKTSHGGTIFWKFNPDYVKFTHAKEYL
jgi:hypothetical protein